MIRNLVKTSDGSDTVYAPEFNDHYHSVNGAITESEHIFIRNGFGQCTADPIHIFEAGFGTGLNALLTAMAAINSRKTVFYTSIEKYPLEMDIIRSLNHHTITGAHELSEKIHSAPWNEMAQITEGFSMLRLKDDLSTFTFGNMYDLIYFDAFGPEKQPELWTQDIFDRIGASTRKDGILITYSAQGEVKRMLKRSGFTVTLLPGPPGKRQMIRAIKM